MSKNEDTAGALHPCASRQLLPEACEGCKMGKSPCDEYTPCSRCSLLGLNCVRQERQLEKLTSGSRSPDNLQVENEDLGYASERESPALAKKPSEIPTSRLQRDTPRTHQKGRSENDDSFIASRIDYSTHDPNVGFVETLYGLCSLSLIELWKSRRRHMPQAPHTNTLKKDVADLGMWTQSFPTGYLDCILEKSDHLKTNIIENLVEIGKIISSLSSSTERDIIDTKEKNNSQAIIDHELTTALEKANIILSSGEHSDTEEDSELSSDEASEDSSSNSDHEQDCYVIEEHVLSLERKDAAQSVPAKACFDLSRGAQPYAMRIQDRFVHTPKFLVERLAEANWERSLRIRNLHQDGPNEENGPSEEIEENPITIFKPFSFWNSGLGSSAPARSEYVPTVASHTSFISLAQDEGQGRPRVPPLPAQGEMFQCDYCLKGVRMRDRIQWKMHVFEDLNSYICTHSECKDALTTFRSRSAWAKHEFDEHFTCKQWRCRTCNFTTTKKYQVAEHVTADHEAPLGGQRLDAAVAEAQETAMKPGLETYRCPFCSQTGWQTRKSYATHVGRHLEEISLASLPRNEQEHSDASSNGDGSNDDKSPKKKSTELVSVPQTRTGLEAHMKRSEILDHEQLSQSALSGIGPNFPRSLVPATTPLVVRHDGKGAQWIAFEYILDRVKMEYTIRCDVKSVNLDDLSEDFKTENCVYPRARYNEEQYKDDRLAYETNYNTLGWALAELNPALRGKRGLIQRAVDSWRNSKDDPRLRSRRVPHGQSEANGLRRPEPDPAMLAGIGSLYDHFEGLNKNEQSLELSEDGQSLKATDQSSHADGQKIEHDPLILLPRLT